LIPKESVSVLEPLTALGQTTPEIRASGPYAIAERFDVALASVAVRRGCDKDLAKAANAAKLPLPGALQFQSGTPYSAFWMTPEMWMVEAPFASHEDIVAHLKPALGDAASITEQTDAWVRFDITASDLQPLFERLSNLDLPHLPVGFASRTVIDHLGVYLVKRAETEITLYGPRASAKSLLHALEQTAVSIL
jgi:sarcosine oxidase subunit gamma